MTLSALMYALMACTLVALVGSLIVEVVRGPIAWPRAARPAASASQQRGRMRRSSGCRPRAGGSGLDTRGAAAAPMRARRRATPNSCPR